MELFPEEDFEISVIQVKQAMNNGHYDLIDVREQFEFSRGLLPGAKKFPMSGIMVTVKRLAKDRPLIIYCEHGVRSLDVTYWLREQGYRAWSMTGGFSEWTGPVEMGD